MFVLFSCNTKIDLRIVGSIDDRVENFSVIEQK